MTIYLVNLPNRQRSVPDSPTCMNWNRVHVCGKTCSVGLVISLGPRHAVWWLQPATLLCPVAMHLCALYGPVDQEKQDRILLLTKGWRPFIAPGTLSVLCYSLQGMSLSLILARNVCFRSRRSSDVIGCNMPLQCLIMDQ